MAGEVGERGVGVFGELDQECNQGNAVGYDIVVTNCTTEKSPGLVREWDYFQVHILYKGIPIKFSHKMNVWINTGGISNGTIVS